MEKRKQGHGHCDTDSGTDIETRSQTCLRVFVKGLKRLITFLLSHVGLTCLVMGYSIMGGLIFKAVELPEEKRTREAVVTSKDAYIDKIVEFFDESDIQRVLDKKIWNEHVNNLLQDYQSELYAFTKDRNWDGRFEGDDYQWSFAESLLYSVTVISTIGYGNITPKTLAGRLLTIAYGIVGIPLTMLCLRNIGNVMAGCFRLIYRCACVNMTYQYIKLKRRRIRQKYANRLQGKTNVLKEWARKKHSKVSSILHHSNAEISEVSEKHHSIGDSTNCIDLESSSITVPFNADSDISELQHTVRRHSDSVVRSFDKSSVERKLSLSTRPHNMILCTHLSMSSDLTVIHEDEIAEVTIDDITHNIVRREISLDTDHASHTTSLLSLTDFDEGERILKAKLKATRELVPISVCMLLVTGYLIFGALIFASWEENWNFLVAFYFCFITLTTIGFGDFVPGMGRLDNDERRVFCVMYLLFGMALLAMSFHLIQEEVRHKCRKLAVRIGLIEEKLTQMLDNYNDALNVSDVH